MQQKNCAWNRWNSHILTICWYTTFPCLFCIWHSLHCNSVPFQNNTSQLYHFHCFYPLAHFILLFQCGLCSSLLFMIICFSALSSSQKILHCPIVISHHNILKPPRTVAVPLCLYFPSFHSQDSMSESWNHPKRFEHPMSMKFNKVPTSLGWKYCH